MEQMRGAQQVVVVRDAQFIALANQHDFPKRALHEFVSLPRRRRQGTSGDVSDDVELVTTRLEELELLAQRVGSSAGLRRAIRSHRWWLQGSRAAVAALGAHLTPPGEPYGT